MRAPEWQVVLSYNEVRDERRSVAHLMTGSGQLPAFFRWTTACGRTDIPYRDAVPARRSDKRCSRCIKATTEKEATR